MTLLQELERKGVILTPKLTFTSAAPLDAETLATLKAHKAELLRDLLSVEVLSENTPNTLPLLPWQLERLLAAAKSGGLPTGTVALERGLVTDINNYTLAWGCAYLTGDRNEALSRLWQVYREWQSTPSS
jgi:hypothetical protein